VDDIRRANRLYTSAIHGREHLVIPGVPGLPKFTEEPPDEMKAERERQRRVKRFQVATKCVEPGEATYYIETNSHDVDAAIKQYLADLEWERTHPLPGGKHATRPGRAAAAAVKRTASAPMPGAAASGSATSLAAFNLFAPIGASSSSSSSSASAVGSSSAPYVVFYGHGSPSALGYCSRAEDVGGGTGTGAH
jgi:hypothetical protein